MGELSPFEEAEMALELAKSPELRLFRERMIEVRNLIVEVNAEDEDQQEEEDWSLSSERRSGLLENFRLDKVESLEPEPAPKSSSSVQWRSVFSIAACFLVSVAAFMMMFLTRGKIYRNEAEIVTYSSASASNEAILQGGMEIVDGTSESMRVQDKKREFIYPNEYEPGSASDEFISKPEMSNEVARKPSSHSSRMAKVIAANKPSSTAVPVPELELKEDSIKVYDLAELIAENNSL